MKNFPRTLAKFIERRSIWIIILAVIISGVLIPGLSHLKQETGIDTMLSSDRQVFKDSKFYTERFGAETNAILFECSELDGGYKTVFSTEVLALLEEFHQEMARTHGDDIHSIIGPVSIFKMAKEEALKQGVEFVWNDQEFINTVLYYQEDDPLNLDGEDTLNPQMKPLIIDNTPVDGNQYVLVNVIPIHGLEHEASLLLVRDIEAFFAEAKEDCRLINIDVSVVGDVEIMDEIDGSMSANLSKLLMYSIAVMAVVLLLMFRVRWNLLSLIMVGLAAMWTFGAMGYAGIPLSMSSMAVLPILIGIGIDYSIQFHNRYQEEVASRQSVSRAIIASIRQMFPVVGIALVATIIGFVTLFISDVPSVQDFGKTLAIGVLLAFIIGLFLLHSVLNIGDRRIPVERAGKASEAAVKFFENSLAASARFSLRHPAPIIVIAIIVAVAGAFSDRLIPSKVDHEELMPQNSQILKDIRNLREITGYAGELHLLIKADDVTSPEVLNWMNDYQNDMFERFPEDLKRADSPATIITEKNLPSETGKPIPNDQAEIDEILANTPEIYLNKVLYDWQESEQNDKQTGKEIASLSFGIRHMPVEEINEVFDDLIEAAEPPAALDIEVAPAGNLALITEAVDAMLGKRSLLNIICLGAVFLVLVFVYRRVTRVIFTIIPVGMVLGWSSFAMFASGVPLNTMTAVLGVLVIGIGTEFIVLLLGRYDEEKDRRGLAPIEAMVIAISRTGRAIITTALTTLGGFAVLISSDFILIRDFGIVTTISVFLCLWAAMAVMPPIVIWWDTRVANRLPKEIADKM